MSLNTNQRLRDFSSLEAVFAAADEAGMEVILDLMHFGWPDFLQIFSPGFVRAFEISLWRPRDSSGGAVRMPSRSSP